MLEKIFLLLIIAITTYCFLHTKLFDKVLLTATSKDLAFLRIGVFFGIFLAAISTSMDITWYTSLPSNLRIPIFLPEFFFEDNYFTKIILPILHYSLIFFSFTAYIGLYSKISMIVSVLLATFILGIPQEFGKVFHYHHLIWFGLVLIFSPCFDSYALDQRLQKNHKSDETNNISKYSLPLTVCSLLICIIYFFPGLWKLLSSIENLWVSKSLSLIMIDQWERYNFIPKIRIDYYPLLMSVLGILLIIFEMSFFIFFLYGRKTRIFIIVTAIIFHYCTYLWMGITFLSLLICYPSFMRSFAFRELPNNNNDFKLDKNKILIFVACFLLTGSIYSGLKKEYSWPFACYPTFDFIQSNEKVRIDIEYEDQGRIFIPDLTILKEKLKIARLEDIRLRIASAYGSESFDNLVNSYIQIVESTNMSLKKFKKIQVYLTKTKLEPDNHWPSDRYLAKSILR